MNSVLFYIDKTLYNQGFFDFEPEIYLECPAQPPVAFVDGCSLGTSLFALAQRRSDFYGRCVLTKPNSRYRRAPRGNGECQVALGRLGEADLRAGLDRGGTIKRAFVVTRQEPDGLPEHVPFLLPSWRRGYVAIALFRRDGIRGWRDLNRLIHFLRVDMRYVLPISLFQDECPRLALLRSMPRPLLAKPDAVGNEFKQSPSDQE